MPRPYYIGTPMSVAIAAAHPLVKYREEFPVFRHSIYLNSCSLGALSCRARRRVNEYLDQWENCGASAWYDIWLVALEELRERYGRLIGAETPSAEISLHPSVSAALGAVAESLDYGRRRKVVTTSLDFPTVPYQWMAKAGEGIEVEVVPSPDATRVPLELLSQAVDGRTAILATSHVFFTSGAIQDVAAVAAICRRAGALLLVDGYQAAGQIPVDVRQLGVDFYCGGGLKWLMGGSGIAFLYANPERTRALCPSVTGWFSHAEPFRFDPQVLMRRTDARRFEGGTPSIAAVYSQLGGLEILEELGVEAIRRVTRELAEDLIATAREAGISPRVAPTPEERSAIVMLPSADPERDVRRLAAAKVIADARPGHVRLSPFFYNVPDDHRTALECLTRA